jgi:hypothetical protein
VRAAARLVAIGGAALVAWMLYRAAPRDVTLVYAVGQAETARSLEIRILRRGELVRRAEFRLAAADQQAKHTVKLPDGHYRVAFRVAPATPAGPAAALEGARELDVSESATIVLPLGR